MKKILALFMACIMSVTMVTGVFASNEVLSEEEGKTVVFTDVPDEYWAQKDIMDFARQGIIHGVGDGRFMPEGHVTREEFSKMLVLSFRKEVSRPASPSFSDVSEERWSYPYVEVCRTLMTDEGAVFDGTAAFYPAQPATRERIASALVKAMGLAAGDADGETSAQKNFTDAESISPQLMADVGAAYKAGLIQGYADGRFNPAGSITRAEAVTMLSRALGQKGEEQPADIPAPTLVISDCPLSTKTATVLIAGTVTDSMDAAPVVTVNGKEVKISGDGSFSHSVRLVPGVNVLEIVASNRFGKQTGITKRISYTQDGNGIVGATVSPGSLAVVQTVSMGLSEEGNPVEQVTFFQSGAFLTLQRAERGYLAGTDKWADLFTPGDVFRYALNMTGQINNVEMVLDIDRDYVGYSLEKSSGGKTTYAAGYVKERGTRFIDLESGESYGFDLDAGGTNLLFDTTKKIQHAFTGQEDAKHIAGYKGTLETPMTDVYLVLLKIQDGCVKEMVAYLYDKNSLAQDLF